jgi:hypothetical protein
MTLGKAPAYKYFWGLRSTSITVYPVCVSPMLACLPASLSCVSTPYFFCWPLRCAVGLCTPAKHGVDHDEERQVDGMYTVFLQQGSCSPCAKDLLDHRQTRYAIRALSADGDHPTHQLLPANFRLGELFTVSTRRSYRTTIQHWLDKAREDTSIARGQACTASR